MTTVIYVRCDICQAEARRPKLAEKRYGLPDGWTDHGDRGPITNADMHHCPSCDHECVLC